VVIRELLIRLGFNLNENGLNRAERGINNLKSNAASATAAITNLAAVLGMAFGAAQIIKIGDAWTNVDSRIGLVTKSLKEQADMQERVYQIAQETRQDYLASGDLFAKIARNSDQLGASLEDVLKVTQAVNEGLVIGGASKGESTATILQLGQALASGRLAGDELRSLSENAPLLFRSIADYYGVAIGKLKDMGAQGELTSEGVFKAILASKDKMDKQFKKMPVTIEQAATYSMNRIGKLIFGINKETSIFQTIAAKIMASTEWIAGKIEKGAKAAGGWEKAFKLVALAIGEMSLAMMIFNARLVTVHRWIAFFRLLRMNIRAVTVALWGMLTNPAVWAALAIAAAVAVLALALEDVYYWATGGESILSDMIGPFSEWESTLQPLVDTFDQIIQALKDMAPNIDLVKASVDLLVNAVKIALLPLIFFLKLVRAWQNIGGLAGIGTGAMKLGSSMTPETFGNGMFLAPPIVNQTNTVQIDQNIAGSGPDLANQVGDATSGAADYSFGKFTRGLEFAIPGGAR